MAEKNDGGAAFPSLERVEKYDDDNGRYVEHFAPVGGMKLRDYFAAKLLPMLITREDDYQRQSSTPRVRPSASEICEIAYDYADHMIAAREK